jgi:SAM-dependent methyltransferase
MDLRGWDERYRSAAGPADRIEPPTPVLVEAAAGRKPGRALDLACGTGRNALWLAEHGWTVTAVDGSRAAIETLRARAAASRLTVDARIADLEKSEFVIEPASWDLIAMCYYLQRDLFAPAKRGLAPGGVIIAIVHLTEPGEEPTKHRLRPGELRAYFADWEILHSREGPPGDPEHRRASAEIVARRATPARTR